MRVPILNMYIDYGVHFKNWMGCPDSAMRVSSRKSNSKMKLANSESDTIGTWRWLIRLNDKPWIILLFLIWPERPFCVRCENGGNSHYNCIVSLFCNDIETMVIIMRTNHKWKWDTNATENLVHKSLSSSDARDGGGHNFSALLCVIIPYLDAYRTRTSTI